MTTDAQWDARWRQMNAHDRQLDARHFPPTPGGIEGMQKANSTAHSFASPWRRDDRSEEQHHHHHQQQTRQLPSMTGSHLNASNGISDPEQRHPPLSGNLTATSPFDQRVTSSWHSLPLSPHAHQDYNSAHAPLTLKIPETQDLPRTTADTKHSYLGTPLSRHQTGTSLPSFASFQEHANRADEPDEVEIAPMSARLTCPQCITLQPLLHEVAAAVSELDELVQVSCNNDSNRSLDISKDNPVRTVHSILERLAKAKNDLQHNLRRGIRYPQEPAYYRSAAPMDDHPSNPLKRSAWSQEDLPPPKRRQSAAFVDGSISNLPGQTAMNERRPSIDFASDSPVPESVPESAFPRTVSPGASARSMKALPSPSSMAYPLSGAPSVLPQAPHSLGSPETSYQAAASIHTASTSSATSAHLADLQHQVTLKSLALQTLQSEYSSLLQKLQRERVKSQTIEKKTTVADQEVNDLTGRNEELAEQVKSLESQLESSERKRESDRAEAAKEKDQWGRMLELGGRIQSKHAEEKQKLKDEIDGLAQQVIVYEKNGGPTLDTIKRDLRRVRQTTPVLSDVGTRTPIAAPVVNRDLQYGMVNGVSDDVPGLKHEIEALNSKIEILRFALEEARRHNQLLDEQAVEVIKRSGLLGTVVQRALQDDSSSALDRTSRIQPGQPDGRMPSGIAALIGPPPTEDAFPPSRASESRKVSHSTVSSSATLASMARAVSPGPAELGFHVTPSTSSPEEIIQALGPVPSPIPGFQLSTPFHMPVAPKNKKTQGSSKRSSKQARRQSVDVVNTWMLPPMNEQPPPPQQQHHHQHQQPDPNMALQLGSFRPLSNHALPASSSTNHTPPYRQGGTPPSQHSSPGPQRDDTSPLGSAGSADGDMSAYVQGRVQLPPMIPQQRNGGQGFEGPRAGDMGAVMPPPPRPGFVNAGREV